MPQLQIRKTKAYTALMIIAAFAAALVAIQFLPVEKLESKPFFESERPMVIAHQGGELLAPSNTMAAFQGAVDMGVDALEFDIHITKDGHLVAIHDATVDRTTNGTGSVEELTLEEIQVLDAGYDFKDLNGKKSYRGKGTSIPTVDEIFTAFSNMKMVIEIKDDIPANRIEEAAGNLWKLIKKYGKEEQVLVVAFDQEIVDVFAEISNRQTALAGGRQEIKNFVIMHSLFLRNFYSPSVDAFQIPVREGKIDLTAKRYMNGAHRRGIDVHYWTIDDKETMAELIRKGADGLITNRPDVMIKLLEEMGY
ncbi:glycerophosphodiester phosphodiesterase [Bacillus sp. ISL-47]|uniref:glycerophosphodiester phosphodiesterase n=1 Tax=Bacillus sp. ISL-47 TaxID=2819130 RepID=UPI001BEA1717|nr:glycerophosphodiester phosphodiesterase [Bacillus sp. ISL-47]MBT2691131.1 glycerophosphodiester phosphodiesterase [Bacillus sp. ISL-47]